MIGLGKRKAPDKRRVKIPGWPVWQARFTANIRAYAAAVKSEDQDAAQKLWDANLKLRDAAARAGFFLVMADRMAALPAFPHPDTIDAWREKSLLALAGGIPGGYIDPTTES